MPLDRIKHPFTLHGKSAGIVIHISMNKEYWCFYLIGMTERTHFIVNIRSLPVRAVLVLKTKWSQRPVICTTTRNSCPEQFRMCKEVSCHECSITMPANCYAVFITNSHFIERFDCRFSVHF